jgi:hypothetical protein
MRGLTCAMILCLMRSATAAYAAPPYDGWAVMSCRIETAMICSDPTVCVRRTAATALLHGAGRLRLHGEEVVMSGTAWNVVIDEMSGVMTGASLAQAGGFLVFGQCAGG